MTRMTVAHAHAEAVEATRRADNAMQAVSDLTRRLDEANTRIDQLCAALKKTREQLRSTPRTNGARPMPEIPKEFAITYTSREDAVAASRRCYRVTRWYVKQRQTAEGWVLFHDPEGGRQQRTA